ncbi:MAG TPA: winged helix-turn-helix domain-containing protein [Steroidobacteraceae bacterium]|nr:winged helix-turn-helix domain-containing protein [Steroidobacteraceae bacterium]
MSQAAQQLEASRPRGDARRILIVERDPDSERTLQGALVRAGFSVTTLFSGEDVLDAIDRDRPHLIMLDWEYPGIVASRLIGHLNGELPSERARLMALSLFSSEHHIVSGFELGLDDYVVRPYSLPVLVARVRAVLRPTRIRSNRGEWVEFEKLRMDLSDLRLMVGEHIVPLRPMEFGLLAFLMHHPERVFTREQLLARVWGRSSTVDARAVDVNIQRTRKALARHGCGEYLQTVRAFGYRLAAVRS